MSLVIVLLLIIKGPSYITLLLVVRLLLQIFTNYLLFLLTVDFYLSLLYNNIIETRRKKMIREKLRQHIKMLIDAFNHNLNNLSEYSLAYNNFLRTEIEMLEKILDEEGAKENE